MSLEPERPIEKLLRACGKKRRDDAGAPFALHPVARRQLQDEVSRRYGAKESPVGSFAAYLARFWPRLALASALTMLVIVAGTIFLPRWTRPGTGKMMASKGSVPKPDMMPQTEAHGGEIAPSRERQIASAPATPPPPSPGLRPENPRTRGRKYPHRPLTATSNGRILHLRLPRPGRRRQRPRLRR
jgi:hypothetical protein